MNYNKIRWLEQVGYKMKYYIKNIAYVLNRLLIIYYMIVNLKVF